MSLEQPAGLRRRPCREMRDREERGVRARRVAGEVPPVKGRRVALWAEGQPTFSTWAPARVPTTATAEQLLQRCPVVDFLRAGPGVSRAAPTPAAAVFPRPGRRFCR